MARPEFINPTKEFSLIGSGKRTNAYGFEGGTAIKFVRNVGTLEQAQVLSHRLKAQYELLQQYMKPYVSDTQFVIGEYEDVGGITIGIVQHHIEGITLEKAVVEGKRKKSDFKYIKDFFYKGIFMQKETGFLPDTFGKFHQTYNPLFTLNIVVMNNEQEEIPILVDTNFSRHSEGKFGSLLHNKLLVLGIQRFLVTLE